MAYNLAKRLKTLGGLTPYEYICQQWQKQPDLFLQNPFHHTLGLYKLKLLPCDLSIIFDHETVEYRQFYADKWLILILNLDTITKNPKVATWVK